MDNQLFCCGASSCIRRDRRQVKVELCSTVIIRWTCSLIENIQNLLDSSAPRLHLILWLLMSEMMQNICLFPMSPVPLSELPCALGSVGPGRQLGAPSVLQACFEGRQKPSTHNRVWGAQHLYLPCCLRGLVTPGVVWKHCRPKKYERQVEALAPVSDSRCWRQ